MHLFASTVFPFFLSPFNWILLLIVVRFFTESVKAKRIYKYAIIFILVVFSNEWLLNAYARYWQPQPRDVSQDKPYSCGILLGGFAGPDENGIGYFNSASDRFIQTVKLYKQGKIKHIIISGGNGKTVNKNFTEGAWAKKEMEIMGIPASDILCEDKSDNTAENAINTKHLLDSVSLDAPYLLITSASHIPRAGLIFENAGIHIVAYPCNYIAGESTFHFGEIIPQPEVLLNWNYYIRETAGYWAYLLKNKL